MTTVRPKEWTYEEFMALPEGGPLHYEIIDGELTMTPAPNTRHQEISGNLFRIISTFLHGNPGSGKVFSAPTDVILSHDPLRAVEPDLVFVSKDRLSLIGEKNIEGAPDLLVEILSEGTENGTAGKIRALRTLRRPRVLDRRPGHEHCSGLSAVRQHIPVSRRIPATGRSCFSQCEDHRPVRGIAS